MKQDFVFPILVLTVICLITSAALAVTESVTAPIIAEAERAAAEEARMEVLPAADSFEPVDLAELSGLPESVQEIYKAKNGAGIVVIASGRGYGGEMRVITGFDKDGKISKTKVLSHSETAGLGSKVAAEPFTSQFVGKDSSLEGVSAIGGATVSSEAFIAIIKDAFNAYTLTSGGEVENPVGLDEAKLKKYYPDVTEFRAVTAADGTRGIICGDAGYAVYEAAEGYHGLITVAVLFGPDDDTILGVVVDSHTETPGLGSKVTEEPFTSQFVGKNSADGVDTITNATYSSNGVKQAVNKAVAKLPAIKEAK